MLDKSILDMWKVREISEWRINFAGFVCSSDRLHISYLVQKLNILEKQPWSWHGCFLEWADNLFRY